MIEQEEQLVKRPPQQHYSQQPYYAEDEIDLRELFAVLWKGKWWIILITGLFAIASVFYALSLPNEYKATAIVAPAAESGSSLNALSGQLGGLASLAGVNLGASEATDSVVAIELMKTWGFADEFIKKHNLQVPIFATKGWDQSSNKLIIDEEIYDSVQKKWIRDAPKGKTVEPTSWELYETFSANLAISQDKETGLINIGYMHFSPEYSQKITTWLIEDVNLIMKGRALQEATKNIAYLEAQISKTPLSDMQNVFYVLIQEQTKTRMLAEVSDEYVFKSVSRALTPEQKSKPKRAIICVAGAFFGGLISLVFIFIRSFVRKGF